MTPNKKRLIFELSGEHPRLPIIELSSVLNTVQNSIYDIQPIEHTHLVKVEFDDFNDFYDLNDLSFNLFDKLNKRLAMCKSIHSLISRNEIDNYRFSLETFKIIDPPRDLTFKLQTKRTGSKATVTKEMLNEIKREIIENISKEFRVNLTHPDIEFFLFYGKEIIVTKKELDIDRSSFENRKPQFRPFFAPISLHPRLARCLVNLGVTKEHGLILDPFCGTGGILVEAGLMGYSVVGADIEEAMVKGVKTNLRHFNINDFTIIHADIDELPSKLSSIFKIDTIVTEPPYGRATTTSGVTLERLMKRSFEVFWEILPKKGRLVISLPDVKFISYAKNYFIKLEEFRIRIHKSLTKYIFVLERK